jgi:hypothetical protein
MTLTRRNNQWALVSKTNPKKVLKWFGPVKPTLGEVRHEEKRVQFFKNKLSYVKPHYRKGRPVRGFVRHK